MPRALEGREKAWGLEHISTLDTVNNLGILYAEQGKLAEAEKMYQRAPNGFGGWPLSFSCTGPKAQGALGAYTLPNGGNVSLSWTEMAMSNFRKDDPS